MTEQTEVLRYIVGPVCTNCYLLVNHKTGELLVVDPGDQAQLIEKQIEKTGAKPVAILLTHGHFDHAGAAEALANKYQISIYAHEAERETLEAPGLNLCGMIGEYKVYHADILPVVHILYSAPSCQMIKAPGELLSRSYLLYLSM